MSHNPFIGARQAEAWGAILGLLLESRWVHQSELRAAGTSRNYTQKSVDNLLGIAQKYGVIARRGTYNSRTKKDYREHCLIPREWMNAAQLAWVDVPARYVCQHCGAPGIGRIRMPDDEYLWLCRPHAERVWRSRANEGAA